MRPSRSSSLYSFIRTRTEPRFIAVEWFAGVHQLVTVSSMKAVTPQRDDHLGVL